MPIERRQWKLPETGVIIKDQAILDVVKYFRKPGDRSDAATMERMLWRYAFEHLDEAVEGASQGLNERIRERVRTLERTVRTD